MASSRARCGAVVVLRGAASARIEDAADDLSAWVVARVGVRVWRPPAPQPPPAAEPDKRGCGGCATGTPVDDVAGLLLVMAAALALRRRA
jgi:MYXO-CTERM domain-containing protein